MKMEDILKDTELAADICHRDSTTLAADTLLKSDTFGDIAARGGDTWTAGDFPQDIFA